MPVGTYKPHKEQASSWKVNYISEVYTHKCTYNENDNSGSRLLSDENLGFNFGPTSGGSRISQKAGGNPSVWGKHLLFGKIFAQNCTKMKEPPMSTLCLPILAKHQNVVFMCRGRRWLHLRFNSTEQFWLWKQKRYRELNESSTHSSFS